MEYFKAIQRVHMNLDFIINTIFGYSLVGGWIIEKNKQQGVHN